MPYKLSILLPGIRVDRWVKLYESIEKSFSGSWEIIFVGPYPLPDGLKDKTNIQYIQDWGTPIRCRQIALVNARGEWINFSADDCTYLENSLDNSFKILEENNMNKNVVVVGKYTESRNPSPLMYQTEYYLLKYHGFTTRIMKEETMLFNTGIISKDLLNEIGGWDCQFEGCALACVDLGIRLNKLDKIKMILQPHILFSATHMPGRSGDHQPIHDGQTLHDQPLFDLIYSGNEIENGKRIKVELNNWERSPDRWVRRFGAS